MAKEPVKEAEAKVAEAKVAARGKARVGEPVKGRVPAMVKAGAKRTRVIVVFKTEYHLTIGKRRTYHAGVESKRSHE